MSTPAQTPRGGELPEFPGRGPFGGIQTEVPLDFVETLGFADCLNIMFRKSGAFTRPRINYMQAEGQAPAIPLPFGAGIMLPQAITGIANFFDILGIRHQVVMTPTALWEWSESGQVFNQITGTLSGGTSQLFTSDVVGGKLYFCQGVDKVQMWDGISATFDDASPNAVPARYLFELGFHLLAAYTVEGTGQVAPQRVRWTGAGDGTDWTSFNAGQGDLFNNLGPITGGVKLFQSGYLFQQWGITQVIPTGIGIAPFRFVPLGSKSKGNIVPYSLVSFGEDIACYIGKNNVYIFDGTSSYPIGDSPVLGQLGSPTRTRSGARKRIFSDLKQCNLQNVFGLISTSVNGNDYECYWIFMPELKLAWIYSFDEGNWTRWSFEKTPVIAGEFNKSGIIRIMDLIGTIQEQSWSPATLTGNDPLDSVLIGFNDGTPGLFDFTGVSELPSLIKSGQCFFGDYRHEHSVRKFRIMQQDVAPVTMTLTVVNEVGQNQSQTFDIGTGSGLTITRVVEFKIKGRSLTWTLSAEAQQPLALSEISPIYDIAGEVRGG